MTPARTGAYPLGETPVKYVLLLLLAVLIYLALRSLRPKSATIGKTLVPPEEAYLTLEASRERSFDACRRALAQTGAEVHLADEERGLFTAGYDLGGRRERLAVIVRVHAADGEGGSEVEIAYKAASFGASHERSATLKLQELSAAIRRLAS
jgi:hypothetical protein